MMRQRLLTALFLGSLMLLWCSCAKDNSSAVPPENKDERQNQHQPAQEQKTAPAPLAEFTLSLPEPRFEGTPTDRVDVTPMEQATNITHPRFYAPSGTVNVALGKPVTSSDTDPVIGTMAMITDGNKDARDSALVELGPFLQHITIDLGEPCELYAVVVWHFHSRPRAYFDVIVQTADDAGFGENVATLFNNDVDHSTGLGEGQDLHYVDTYQGKIIDAKGTRARYVRLYSNGNSENDLNHYLEVEVYGLPLP